MSLQQADIALLDMPTVLAQVQGNAVGARLFGLDGRLHRVRIARTPCLAQGCHVVDIHAQQNIRINRHTTSSRFHPQRLSRGSCVSCPAAVNVASRRDTSRVLSGLDPR